MKANRVGECDQCASVGVELWIRPAAVDTLALCEKCRNEEDAAIERATKQIPQVSRASYLEHARTSQSLDGKTTLKDAFRSLDPNAMLKEQLFNADTPSIVEMESRVYQDESIPADRKLYICSEETYKLFKTQQDIVFRLRQETTEAENLMRKYQSAGTDYVAQLEVKDREKFTEFNKNYKPQSPKGKPKPNPSVEKRKKGKVVSTSPILTRKQTTLEIERVCREYGVKENLVRMFVTVGNTPEEAAKKAREMDEKAAAARA